MAASFMSRRHGLFGEPARPAEDAEDRGQIAWWQLFRKIGEGAGRVAFWLSRIINPLFSGLQPQIYTRVD